MNRDLSLDDIEQLPNQEIGELGLIAVYKRSQRSMDDIKGIFI